MFVPFRGVERFMGALAPPPPPPYLFGVLAVPEVGIFCPVLSLRHVLLRAAAQDVEGIDCLVLRVHVLSCARQPWCWCAGVLWLPFPNWWFVTTSHARFGQYTFWGGWCSRFLGNASPACAGSTRVLSRSQQCFNLVVVEIIARSLRESSIKTKSKFYGNFPFSFCLVLFLFPSPVVSLNGCEGRSRVRSFSREPRRVFSVTGIISSGSGSGYFSLVYICFYADGDCVPCGYNGCVLGSPTLFWGGTWGTSTAWLYHMCTSHVCMWLSFCLVCRGCVPGGAAIGGNVDNMLPVITISLALLV
ncbi:unnamed protein product [Ectocarpus sp. 12 AP-2014]